MDTITIDSLHLKAIIGVNENEKVTPQDLYLTISLGVDVHEACHSDNLVDTVDYDELAKNIIKFVEESRYELIETLSYQCVQRIFKFSEKIQQIEFTVSKPDAIPKAITTMFTMVRSRI